MKTLRQLILIAFVGLFSINCNAQTTNNTDMDKVYEFIKACKTYYIATVDGDQPRVRPFGTIHKFEGKLYIQTGKKKRTAQQLKANPKAELCCFNGSQWVRLSGELVPDERVEAKKSMLDAYPELRSMYNENDANTIVYYFKNATAYFSSFTSPDEEIKF
ncbi:MAG: pyridoxamine 5'-phosphate oxidase family protein [Prevotellaceae bacterium]|nr:pyridoxamine 5'-phosphate oxidase family protein [Candidatus Colivivens equi]